MPTRSASPKVIFPVSSIASPCVSSMISACQCFGVNTFRYPRFTGIWFNTETFSSPTFPIGCGLISTSFFMNVPLFLAPRVPVQWHNPDSVTMIQQYHQYVYYLPILLHFHKDSRRACHCRRLTVRYPSISFYRPNQSPMP